MKGFVLPCLLIFSLTLFLFVSRQLDLGKPTLEMAGAELPGNIGSRIGQARIAQEGKDPGGCLIYGPYICLAEGFYDFQLQYSATSADSGVYDLVYQGAPSLTRLGKLAVRRAGWLVESLSVGPEDVNKAWEFRVWYSGKGMIRVEKLVVQKKSPSSFLWGIVGGGIAGAFLSFLFLQLSSVQEGRPALCQERKLKDALLLGLAGFASILNYPFPWGIETLRIIWDVAVVYIFLVGNGMGIYFLLVPNHLRNPLLFISLAPAMGLLSLSIIAVYIVSWNKPAVFSLYGSLLVAGVAFALSAAGKKVSLSFTGKRRERLPGQTAKTLLMILSLLLIILSPVLRTGFPTTPYRVGIDHAGYGEIGQFLLEGGTLKEAAREIAFQVNKKNLNEALQEHQRALRFNSYVDAEFLLKTVRQGYGAILATFAFLTLSDHVFKVQFISLIISYLILFGLTYYFARLVLHLRESTSLLVSLSLVLNSNLLNVYYEGQYVQIFFMPFFFLLLLPYFHLRESFLSPDLSKRDLWRKPIPSILLTGFILAGMLNIFNEGSLVVLALLLLWTAADLLWNPKMIGRSIVFWGGSFLVGFGLILPHSLQWIKFVSNQFQSFNHAGFWQPHWASPAEMIGIFNMYVPAYTQHFPRLLERSGGDWFGNLLFSGALLVFLFVYLQKKKNLDRSFWLAPPFFVFLVFMKSSYFDRNHNYNYMKAYTILLPFLLIFWFQITEFFSLRRVGKGLATLIHYLVPALIVCNGMAFISQYLKESRVVTRDMFGLYEHNKSNKNEFNEYVFITQKGRIEEFMLTPLIPFHWLNQGEGKEVKPHLNKRVVFLIRKEDLASPSILNAYREDIIHEDSSFVMIRTPFELKELYDPQGNKYDWKLAIKAYKDLFG